MSTSQCTNGGYCLDSLPKPSCPECGKAFAPDDPATFHVDQPGDPNERILDWFIFIGVAVIVLILAMCLIGIYLFWRDPMAWK